MRFEVAEVYVIDIDPSVGRAVRRLRGSVLELPFYSLGGCLCKFLGEKEPSIQPTAPTLITALDALSKALRSVSLLCSDAVRQASRSVPHLKGNPDTLKVSRAFQHDILVATPAPFVAVIFRTTGEIRPHKGGEKARKSLKKLASVLCSCVGDWCCWKD